VVAIVAVIGLSRDEPSRQSLIGYRFLLARALQALGLSQKRRHLHLVFQGVTLFGDSVATLYLRREMVKASTLFRE